jgi:hypothetical protein
MIFLLTLAVPFAATLWLGDYHAAAGFLIGLLAAAVAGAGVFVLEQDKG